MIRHKKLLVIPLIFVSLLAGNFVSASSCQCTVRATATPGSCEQKTENDCYAQVNTKQSCAFFTDDNCKTLQNVGAPGLLWTALECHNAKPAGIWAPPDQTTTIGPYCYEQQDFNTPFMLSVDILGINKAGGIKNIGQYVNLLYQLVMGLAIFFTIIMTSVAGFKWLTAAGNTGKIGEAKKMIGNAVIGLILAAGAYTILQTINPRLLELHLPLIPKIKTESFVGVTTCDKYLTQLDCEKNPLGLNTGISAVAPAGYTANGCSWNGTGCVQTGKRADGDLGGNCLKVGDQYSCNSANLTCIVSAGFHLCTDGSANAVCGGDSDCKDGLKCATGTNAQICYDPSGKRPQGVSCDQNNQCSSGVCEAGHCTVGQCDPTQCPVGQVCLLVGTSQYKQCGNPPKCDNNNVCVTQYGSGYFCPNVLYNQTGGIKLASQYITVNYGAANTANAKNCQPGKSTGADCWFNDECANGSCNGLDVTQNKLGKCN